MRSMEFRVMSKYITPHIIGAAYLVLCFNEVLSGHSNSNRAKDAVYLCLLKCLTVDADTSLTV